ncbi:MAG: hypothetical protein WBO97_12790 [Tepidiformaceae bacterium]
MEELTETPPADDTPVCVHHWKLGVPASGITPGVCRECGATREFGQSFAPSSYGRPRRK